jgi:MFS family permease
LQQNATTAAIVKHIDAELGIYTTHQKILGEFVLQFQGPTTYYNWILSSYTIATAIALPLSGGLSDIFGRRPFFIVGCCISLSGTIVALAAQNIPMIIVGMILKGIGAGSQQLA